MPTVEGRRLENLADDGLLAYVEVHRTGYVEAARCDAGILFEGKPYVDAITTLKALHAAVSTASRLQEGLNGADRWHVGLYLARTAVPSLFTFLPPTMGIRGRTVMPNLRIEETVEADDLSRVVDVLRRFDLPLANAFGLEQGEAIHADGSWNRLEERF